MRQAYQDLLAVLGKELALFNDLRSLLVDEEKPLIEFDTEKIDAITKAKQTIELRLKILEQSRLHTIVILAKKLNIPPEEASLRKLAEFAPNGQRETLLKAREAFIKLTSEIAERIETNGRLINTSLRLVHGVQQIISRAIEEPATYAEEGQLRKAAMMPRRESRRV